QLLMGLRESTFAHLMRLSHRFYERAKVGDLMSRLTSDLLNVQQAAAQVIGNGIFQALVALGSAVAIVWLNPLLGLLVLAVLPPFVASYFMLRDRLQEVSRDQQRRAGEAASAAQESIAGHAGVKAFGMEERTKTAYHARLMAQLHASMRLVKLSAIADLSIVLAVTTGQLLVLGVGGYLVIRGHLTVGTLMAFV